MEGFFHSVAEALSHNIMVHIYSLPNFAIETVMIFLICIVHLLLILEVNNIVAKIVQRSDDRLKNRPIEPTFSRISIHSNGSRVTHVKRYYYDKNLFSKKLPNNAQWGSLDRIDQILSVTPSEYVRRDKEKHMQEKDLRSCLQSLTTLLECAVSQKLSNKNVQNSINLIRENLSFPKCDDDSFMQGKLLTQSLYDIMEKTLVESALNKAAITTRVRFSTENLTDSLENVFGSSKTASKCSLELKEKDSAENNIPEEVLAN